MESNKNAPEVASVQYKRVEDFQELYANNVFLEASLWDMKLVLGNLDQKLGPTTIVQHAAVTLPWAAVKVLRYFLGVHLLAHELQNGKVFVPPNVVPAIPEEIPEEVGAVVSPAKAKAIHAALRECYADFIKSNPESAPPTE